MLEAPDEYLARFANTTARPPYNSTVRLAANAMSAALDDAVRNVTDALAAAALWNEVASVCSRMQPYVTARNRM